MNDTVYAWETQPLIIDSAYTQFFVEYQSLMEFSLICIGILLFVSMFSIWLLPKYTFVMFATTSFLFGLSFLMIFNNKDAGLYLIFLSFLCLLIGAIKAERESKMAHFERGY